MISITRLNNSELYLNADLIQSVEGTSDTVITMTNDVKIVVKEPPEVVVAKIISYQRIVRNNQLDLHVGV